MSPTRFGVPAMPYSAPSHKKRSKSGGNAAVTESLIEQFVAIYPRDQRRRALPQARTANRNRNLGRMIASSARSTRRCAIPEHHGASGLHRMKFRSPCQQGSRVMHRRPDVGFSACRKRVAWAEMGWRAVKSAFRLTGGND